MNRDFRANSVGEQLQLTLLGNLEVSRDGVPVTDLRSGKAQALLCYLAVSARPHLRSTLVGLLWGETSEASGRNNLSKALTNLRKLVGPHLSITRQAVAFNRDAAYWLDVELFEGLVGGASAGAASARADIERLQEAVALYRGDFLEGFYVRQAPAFEQWALAQRARLRESALQALYTLAAYYTGQGEAGRAAGINYTTRLLALEPWREEAHRQLMLLLAHAGQRGAAVAQYRTCCQVLAEGLGVEPAAETVALYEQVRAGKLEVPIPTREPEIAPRPPTFLEGETAREMPARPVFVARERELERLNGFLETALTGRGGVVFVTGGPGRGKTALVREFARHAMEAHPDLLVAGGHCNAFSGVGDPYLPFREVLEMLAGDVEARWAAGAITREHARRLWGGFPAILEALVDHGPSLIDSLVPAAALLSRAAALGPQAADCLGELKALSERRRLDAGGLEPGVLLAQYTRVLHTVAVRHPLLLILDDLQWADAGSIDLLFHLGQRFTDAGNRILIAGAYRPEEVALDRDGARHPLGDTLTEFKHRFGDAWVDLAGVHESESRRFVDALLDVEPNRLGEAFREALFQRTGGHPLFTIELLRAMQEQGDLVQDELGKWVEGPSVNWERQPARVEAVIERRVGQLEEGLRDLLTVASVEGERFTAQVVAQVLDMPEREALRALSELGARHRLMREMEELQIGGRFLSRYQFAHALFQEYLYGGLSAGERRLLHGEVAMALEARYGEQAEQVAVRLARHYHEAGMTAKAVHFLYQAGRRAVRLSAFEEAVAHLSRGLNSLKTLPDTPQRARLELDLQIALGPALMSIKGSAAPEVEGAYVRARELCREASSRGFVVSAQPKGPARGVEETPQLFPVLWGLHEMHLARGSFQQAREFSEQCLQLAQSLQDPDLLLQAYHALWGTAFYAADLASCLAYAEQGVALYDPQQHHSQAFLYGGHDPGVCALALAAQSLWFLGCPDQALKRLHEALALAQELSHPQSLALALQCGAKIHQFRQEEQAAQEWAEAAITLATEYGLGQVAAQSAILRGWALTRQGQAEEGIPQMRHGLDAWRAAGTEIEHDHYISLLAEAYKVGKIQEGLTLLAEALAGAQRRGEGYYQPELHRLKGDLLSTQSTQGEPGIPAASRAAEACFQGAIEVARQQNAKSWELRATVSLCRLWKAQGKREEARQMLEGIYEWFTEGFDTVDLKETKALLDELSED
jgi:predicted ATPase/DNA-binding SARP family transcriptional activator